MRTKLLAPFTFINGTSASTTTVGLVNGPPNSRRRGLIKGVSVAVITVGALSAWSGLRPSPVSAQSLLFKKNHVKFDTHRYFIRGATEVTIGAYGLKKSPVTQPNYLLVDRVLKNAPNPEKSGPHAATFSSGATIGHNGAVAVPIKLVNLGISSAGMSKMVRQGKCVFEHLFLNMNACRRAIMGNRAAKSFFKNNNAARMVHSVLRVKSCKVDAKRIRAVALAGNVNVAEYVGVKGLDRAQDEVDVSFAYGKDTIFAYRLSKAKWDKKNKKKRKTIERCDDDQAGID